MKQKDLKKKHGRYLSLAMARVGGGGGAGAKWNSSKNNDEKEQTLKPYAMFIINGSDVLIYVSNVLVYVTNLLHL